MCVYICELMATELIIKFLVSPKVGWFDLTASNNGDGSSAQKLQPLVADGV